MHKHKEAGIELIISQSQKPENKTPNMQNKTKETIRIDILFSSIQLNSLLAAYFFLKNGRSVAFPQVDFNKPSCVSFQLFGEKQSSTTNLLFQQLEHNVPHLFRKQRSFATANALNLWGKLRRKKATEAELLQHTNPAWAKITDKIYHSHMFAVASAQLFTELLHEVQNLGAIFVSEVSLPESTVKNENTATQIETENAIIIAEEFFTTPDKAAPFVEVLPCTEKHYKALEYTTTNNGTKAFFPVQNFILVQHPPITNNNTTEGTLPEWNNIFSFVQKRIPEAKPEQLKLSCNPFTERTANSLDDLLEEMYDEVKSTGIPHIAFSALFYQYGANAEHITNEAYELHSKYTHWQKKWLHAELRYLTKHYNIRNINQVLPRTWSNLQIFNNKEEQEWAQTILEQEYLLHH